MATYAEDGGIVGDGGWFVLLDARVLLDAEVLHVAAAEDNVLVDLVRGRDLVLRPASAALGAVGPDIFERYGRLFGVDFVEDADVAARQ